jgi:predicted dithiol-disulfide oxidoreductase (DUF899 family)
MHHEIVPHRDWIAARSKLLNNREKEFTRLRDELSRERRELPWERVDKAYTFEGPNGAETLAELFDGRSQLVVYHFMFAPEWEVGCPHCSHWADNFNGVIVHLNQRDVTMVAVSRAPYPQLAAYKKRMGWSFKRVSSFSTDFNFDYGVSFTPEDLASKEALYKYGGLAPGVSEREGVSVFYREGTDVFHT